MICIVKETKKVRRYLKLTCNAMYTAAFKLRIRRYYKQNSVKELNINMHIKNIGDTLILIVFIGMD